MRKIKLIKLLPLLVNTMLLQRRCYLQSHLNMVIEMKITSTNHRKSSLKNIKISTAAGLITITTNICLDFWVCLGR